MNKIIGFYIFLFILEKVIFLFKPSKCSLEVSTCFELNFFSTSSKPIELAKRNWVKVTIKIVFLSCQSLIPIFLSYSYLVFNF